MSNLNIDVIYVVYKHHNETIYSIKSLKNMLSHCQINAKVHVFDNSFNIVKRSEVEKFICFVKESSDSNISIEYIPSDKNLGFGSGCNYVFKKGFFEKVLIVNCDTSFEKTNPEEFKKFFLECNSSNVIIGPRIINERNFVHASCFSFDPISILFKPLRHVRHIGRFTKVIPEYKAFKKRIDRITYEGLDKNQSSKVDWVSGCCLLIYRNFFANIGGFDERFFLYFEDVDLCRKAKQIGLNVVFYPSLSVIHKGRHESRNHKGIFNSITKNIIARYHISSWLKYMFKWRRDFLYKLLFVLKRFSNKNNYLNKKGYFMDFSKFEPIKKK